MDREALVRDLTAGSEFPFDAPDSFWEDSSDAPPAVDWAHAAARGIINNLQGRRGIKNQLENIDEDLRVEIVQELAELIRLAQSDQPVPGGGRK